MTRTLTDRFVGSRYVEARSWPAGAQCSAVTASDLQAEGREFEPRCVQLLAFTFGDPDVTPVQISRREEHRSRSLLRSWPRG